MLSNQIFQKTVQDIKTISGFECAVWNLKTECIAMSHPSLKDTKEEIRYFIEKEEKSQGNILLFKVAQKEESEYILEIMGEGKEAELAGKFGANQLETLMMTCRDRMDKNKFIQNVILGNMLLVDVYNQAKKMRIPIEQKRVVFLIEPKSEGENLILETLKGLFASTSRDFITAVDESNVILVKELEEGTEYPQIKHIAEEIVDTLNMEAMAAVRIAYGTMVEELKDISKSYQEARVALEVGRVFYAEKTIDAYNELGIGRLIHQLSPSLCEMFLDEAFGGRVVSGFEEEELLTVYTFFENNLNISETARQLFLHRNTLVYRLEKIQKKTGLDVRKFDDALVFKIAIMVEDHIRSSKEDRSRNKQKEEQSND